MSKKCRLPFFRNLPNFWRVSGKSHFDADFMFSDSIWSCGTQLGLNLSCGTQLGLNWDSQIKLKAKPAAAAHKNNWGVHLPHRAADFVLIDSICACGTCARLNHSRGTANLSHTSSWKGQQKQTGSSAQAARLCTHNQPFWKSELFNTVNQLVS